MAKYNVYGVGNAVTDKEFEVSDQFFAEHDIQKGVMTLVDFEQQTQLLAALTKDHTLRKQAGGGSAGNTLYALTQFGGEAFFACKVANDDIGDFYLEQLGHHNIDTNVSRREEGASACCLVMVSPDAERTMHTYLGISADLSLDEIDFEAAKDSEYIYIEGYLVTSPPAKAAILQLKDHARQHGIKVAMSFSDPAMLEYFNDDINDVLGEDGVDLLFCNATEAMLWAGQQDFRNAFEALKGTARQFVVTRGPDGALAWDGEQEIAIAGNPVKAIDTNGAGDLFAGAFLYGITQGKEFADAGRLASLAASEVVTQYGPRLPGPRHAELRQEVLGS